MTRAWETLDRVASRDGELALLRRGSDDYLIQLGGRVLMNSRESRSEVALAELACRGLGAAAPRVLVGGLGMGCSLRAALAELPARARVLVAELHEPVAAWCAGPLAALNERALSDARVELRIADVADVIRETAATRGAPRFDAILLDLFEGPHADAGAARDPCYGDAALARTRRALAPDGRLAVWSEGSDAAFERRLARAGFGFERHRPGRGGRRHAVYLARPR